MTQENVAAVKTAFDALARGEIDRFIEQWTDDLDHRAIQGAPDDRGPMHGEDALRAYLEDWFDTFDDFRVEVVDTRSAAQGSPAAVSTRRAGRPSKPPGCLTGDVGGERGGRRCEGSATPGLQLRPAEQGSHRGSREVAK